MSATPFLDVHDLCVDYTLAAGRLRAVDHVNLHLETGRVLGIAGASGSGKSTVALALLGLLDPRATRCSGAIHSRGQDLMRLDAAAWQPLRGRQIAAVFQSPQGSFNPTMTIGQHLEETIRARLGVTKAQAATRALEALDRVQMPRANEVLRSYAFELSGGMCQRASIALALVQEPSLLIADEPTSSLDVLAQVEICRLLRSLNQELGLSMIVISHDLGLIGQLADGVAVMQAGRCVEAGEVDEVFARPQHAYTRQLLEAAVDLDTSAVAWGEKA